MKLYTVQMSKWRVAKRQCIPFVDTTVRTAPDHIFAPNWDMVMGHKSGELENSAYTELYLRRMRRSYMERREEWLAFLQKETAAIACYCPAGAFCHRRLLIPILDAVAKKHGIAFEYMGEIS